MIGASFTLDMVSFYMKRPNNPTLMLCCLANFTPSCIHEHHFSMLLMVKCFTLGIDSQCLSEWEVPIANMNDFFLSYEIYNFFYGKMATHLVGTLIIGGGLKVTIILAIHTMQFSPGAITTPYILTPHAIMGYLMGGCLCTSQYFSRPIYKYKATLMYFLALYTYL